MAEISFLTSLPAGPQVATKAQSSVIPMTTPNCIQGKKNFSGKALKTACYSAIVYPTMTPIITPSRQLANTRINAS